MQSLENCESLMQILVTIERVFDDDDDDDDMQTCMYVVCWSFNEQTQGTFSL